jgi:hypothetical protein
MAAALSHAVVEELPVRPLGTQAELARVLLADGTLVAHPPSDRRRT